MANNVATLNIYMLVFMSLIATVLIFGASGLYRDRSLFWEVHRSAEPYIKSSFYLGLMSVIAAAVLAGSPGIEEVPWIRISAESINALGMGLFVAGAIGFIKQADDIRKSKKELIFQAAKAILYNDKEKVKLYLRQYFNDGSAIKYVAKELSQDEKSVRNMVKPEENPTLENLVGLFKACTRRER